MRVPRTASRKAALVAMLGAKCHRCGAVLPDICYDLHHRVPSMKMRSISSAIGSAGNDEFENDVVPEVRRMCVLLCANCHRVVTFLGEDADAMPGRN